jgi:CDP-diacylglycerol--serine O-phosphatidyltransferase
VNKSSANTITLINIIFGSLSLISTLHENYKYAAVFILLAVVMDSLDGRIARRLGIISDMGKELDSLCDLVSFGVAPALLVYSQDLYFIQYELGLLAAILYIMCGAFRLARFNVLNIKEYFVGVPITFAGAMLAIMSLLYSYLPNYSLILVVVLFSLLMISNIKIKKC